MFDDLKPEALCCKDALPLAYNVVVFISSLSQQYCKQYSGYHNTLFFQSSKYLYFGLVNPQILQNIFTSREIAGPWFEFMGLLAMIYTVLVLSQYFG